MDDQNEDFFIRIKEELKTYLTLRLELFKVSSYEKIARVTASLLSGLMLGTLFLFFAIFASVMSGFYFSALTGSKISGFGIVAGIYLLMFILLIVFRKQLFEKIIINKMIEILFENDDKPNQ